MSQIARTGFTCQDPLDFLARKRVEDFTKGRLIYGVEKTSNGLYVVILGRLKGPTTADDGCHTLSRMVRAPGLFGEPSLVGRTDHRESVTALDNVTLMS